MKNMEKISNFLGNDTKFEGKLTCHGTIRIDGHYKGEISAQGTLIVGEEGMVDSHVHARYIVISGEVHGDVVADEKIEIRPPGKVFGNIQAPSIVINQGVVFEGSCQMLEAKKGVEKPQEVASRVESEVDTVSDSSPQDESEEIVSKANP